MIYVTPNSMVHISLQMSMNIAKDNYFLVVIAN